VQLLTTLRNQYELILFTAA
jgi:TFIIF-interacting CTD phosphatase-like protein